MKEHTLVFTYVSFTSACSFSMSVKRHSIVGPVDVIHEQIIRLKRDDTHRLTEGLLVEVLITTAFNFTLFRRRCMAFNLTEIISQLIPGAAGIPVRGSPMDIFYRYLPSHLFLPMWLSG